MTDQGRILYEYQRMCNANSNCDCPISKDNNGMNIDCNEFIQNYSEKAATLIMQWAAEHHRKTYAEDFFEKFPNAIKNEDGLPLVSIFDIYGEVNNDAWWESPMPAEESWRDKVNKLDWGEEF